MLLNISICYETFSKNIQLGDGIIQVLLNWVGKYLSLIAVKRYSPENLSCIPFTELRIVL